MKNCCRFFGVLLAGKRQSSCCSLVLQSLHLVLQFSRHLTWWHIVLKSPHLMIYSPALLSSHLVLQSCHHIICCYLVFQLPHLVLANTSIISLRSAWHFSHLTWCQSLVFQSPLQATKSGPLIASPGVSWSSLVISPGATWYFIHLTWCHNAVFQSAYLVYTVRFFGHLTWCKLVLELSHPVLKSGPTVTIPENKGLLRRHLTWCQSPVLSHITTPANTGRPCSHLTCRQSPVLLLLYLKIQACLAVTSPSAKVRFLSSRQTPAEESQGSEDWLPGNMLFCTAKGGCRAGEASDTPATT